MRGRKLREVERLIEFLRQGLKMVPVFIIGVLTKKAAVRALPEQRPFGRAEKN
jgi:hypothetical protein